MIKMTGDSHGNQQRWIQYIDPVLAPKDILIVTGDFGYGFWNGPYWSQETFFDYLSEKDCTTLFIDGNHENFSELNSLPVETWCGGKVHLIRHNVLHLIRGEVFCIEGNTIFVMGGGYSFDRYRRTEGISWWPEEMPSEMEYKNALKNLGKVQYHVDYILTHTAPSETVAYLSTLNIGVSNDFSEEYPLTTFLNEIQHKTFYRHWYFGHFHIDRDLWRNQTVLLNSIRELSTGKVIQSW